MKTVLITGPAGLVSSECVKRFGREGYRVAGIDSDLRKWFFGAEASTLPNRRFLAQTVKGYEDCDFDIRDQGAVKDLFKKLGRNIAQVVHTAAQPSHDWAEHIWWISDVGRFQSHYPSWKYRHDVRATLKEIHQGVCGAQ